MKIAFFDSGLGGLTVLREAVKLLPHEEYYYFADSLHVPYGPKPKEEVREYIFQAVDKLSQMGIKALVVACNTATSIAVNELRQTCNFPVIGIEPAVKPAVERFRESGQRVLVLATLLTLQEPKFHELVRRVDDENIVDYLPFPELVEHCENLQYHDDIILPLLKNKLTSYDMSQYGVIVLGCTHFPFYKWHLKKILPNNIEIIDGSVGTTKRLKQVLEENSLLREQTNQEPTQITYLSSLDDGGEQKRMERAMNYLIHAEMNA
ncbi:glutamate racemase [Brevibacillus ginsengisoli]|uniref:glutamate racemase n=1 Tax=Brevibacillus ginsengisoli TaxID=363854 RepID=UPI003CEBB419